MNYSLCWGSATVSKGNRSISPAWFILIGATGWLLFISLLHLGLNGEHDSRKIVSMGYMPVITNLAAPLLDHASKINGDVYFKALKFSSFAEMAEAFRHDKIQAAFIIAPLAIVLHQQHEDIRIVYIGNRHESTFVARKDLNIQSFDELAGKTIAVPMRYSGHNIAVQKLMEETGLTGKIKVVELNPPDMSSALMAGSLDGYFVGEPFAAQTLKNGTANLVFHVEDVWDSFICNLVLVKQQLIEDEPDTVRTLVEGAIRAGFWAKDHPRQAASVAADYWNQSVELVEYALTRPSGRIVYDQYVPKEDEIQEIADLMKHFSLAASNNIQGLVDEQFARSVSIDSVDELNNIFLRDASQQQ